MWTAHYPEIVPPQRTPVSLEFFLMLATAKLHYAVVYCTVSGKPLS